MKSQPRHAHTTNSGGNVHFRALLSIPDAPRGMGSVMLDLRMQAPWSIDPAKKPALAPSARCRVPFAQYGAATTPYHTPYHTSYGARGWEPFKMIAVS
jgi:hypothetical protein